MCACLRFWLRPWQSLIHDSTLCVGVGGAMCCNHEVRRLHARASISMMRAVAEKRAMIFFFLSPNPPPRNSFQVLSKNDLAAFNQHLSSVIPLLLSLADGQCGGGGGGVRQAGDVKGGGTARAQGTRGDAMSRFRAVQCLTALTALPYSRLHPFKTQVRCGVSDVVR